MKKELHFDVLIFEGDDEDPAYVMIIQYNDDGKGMNIPGSEEIYIIFRQADVKNLIAAHHKHLCPDCIEDLQDAINTFDEAENLVNVPPTHITGAAARAMAATIALAMTAVINDADVEESDGDDNEGEDEAAPGSKKPHELN